MNKIKAITPKTKNLNDNVKYKYVTLIFIQQLKLSTEPIMELCAIDDNPQLKPG